MIITRSRIYGHHVCEASDVTRVLIENRDQHLRENKLWILFSNETIYSTEPARHYQNQRS